MFASTNYIRDFESDEIKVAETTVELPELGMREDMGRQFRARLLIKTIELVGASPAVICSSSRVEWVYGNITNMVSGMDYYELIRRTYCNSITGAAIKAQHERALEHLALYRSNALAFYATQKESAS